MEDDMNRIAIAFAVFASLTVPAYAQTHEGSPVQAPMVTTPADAVRDSQQSTNLPGVDDSATTGSTDDATGEPGPNERCEFPGTTENTNPTADLPTVQEANPSCR
jgi:hypothetical protein